MTNIGSRRDTELAGNAAMTTILNLNVPIDPPFRDMKPLSPDYRGRNQPMRSTRVTRGNANQAEKQHVVDQVPNARDKVFQCDCGKRYGYRESIYNHKKHGKCTGKPWGSALIISIPASSIKDDVKETKKRRRAKDDDDDDEEEEMDQDEADETDSNDSSSSPAPVMQPNVRQHRTRNAAQATRNKSPVDDSTQSAATSLTNLSNVEERKPDVSMLVQQPPIVHPPQTTIQYPSQALYGSMAPPSVPPLSSAGSTPTPDSTTSKKPPSRVRQPEHEKAFACDCGKRFAYKTSIYHHKNRGGCPGRPWVTSEGGHRNRAKTGKHLSMMRAHELAQKMGEVGTLNVDFDNVPDHLRAEFQRSEALGKASTAKRKKSSTSNASDSSSSLPGTSQDDGGAARQQKPHIGLKIREWKEPRPRHLSRSSLSKSQVGQDLVSKSPLSGQTTAQTPTSDQIPDPIAHSLSAQGGTHPSPLSMQPNATITHSAPPSVGIVDGQEHLSATSQQNINTAAPLEIQDTNGEAKRPHSATPIDNTVALSLSFTQSDSHLANQKSRLQESGASSHASMDYDDGANSDNYIGGDVDVDDEACVSKTRWGPAGAELARFLAYERFHLPKPASPTLTRPYVCLVPGCGRSYKNSNGLAAHFSSVKEPGHGELGRKLRDEAKEKDSNPNFVGIFDTITRDESNKQNKTNTNDAEYED
ncbi:hypothetical protein E3P99_01273 [Wallemia hederae]|uniref:C2H2-type domain-containing protein n=1 Tax=Wallemia hederae TaxID=1540922 RepID=A0A4T0FS26_9BASI|nr:hypothetical protein E3P99_01273 [Wallemia hederae]